MWRGWQRIRPPRFASSNQVGLRSPSNALDKTRSTFFPRQSSFDKEHCAFLDRRRPRLASQTSFDEEQTARTTSKVLGLSFGLLFRGHEKFLALQQRRLAHERSVFAGRNWAFTKIKGARTKQKSPFPESQVARLRTQGPCRRRQRRLDRDRWSFAEIHAALSKNKDPFPSPRVLSPSAEPIRCLSARQCRCPALHVRKMRRRRRRLRVEHRLLQRRTSCPSRWTGKPALRVLRATVRSLVARAATTPTVVPATPVPAGCAIRAARPAAAAAAGAPGAAEAAAGPGAAAEAARAATRSTPGHRALRPDMRHELGLLQYRAV